MSKEVLDMIEVLANEKNVSKDIVISALESAMASAVKKSDRFENEDADIVAKIDPNTGDYQMWRRWLVVPDEQGLQQPDREILEWEAKEDYSDQGEMNPGDYVLQELDNVNLSGRRFAMDAKQVIMQKLREAERARILEEFLEKNQDQKIFVGHVKALPKGDAIIESGRLEARLPKGQMIPRQNLRPGDQVRAYILSIDPASRQQPITLSRTCPEFLIELLRKEVPEIDQGFLEVKGCVREPGVRAKIAVQAKDKRIDPIGTCVGPRGSRVQAVTKELFNERIDIIRWSDQIAEYVVNALAPAVITSVVVHEDTHRVEVVAEEEKFAIGSAGQNIDLASRLTGWTISVMNEKDAEEKQMAEEQGIIRNLVDHLDIDEEVARLFIDNGIETLEEVAYFPEDILMGIEGLEPESIKELRKRAQAALLTLALQREELLKNIPKEILELDGMDNDLACSLWQKGIRTLDDLADLSTDELCELTNVEKEKAEKVISEARKHWDEQ